jgi:queuine tRNA-ribosyltransferase
VRTLDWDDVVRMGYRHVLMNTYHLVVRPGVEALRQAGGVKAYTGWGGGVLTDSGGYQVYSLAAKRVLREDGVRFTDHIAGDRWHFTPRSVLEAQVAFGVDFAMCLDVCTGLPATRKQVARDMALTHAWAREQAELWPELRTAGSAGFSPRENSENEGVGSADGSAGFSPRSTGSGGTKVPPTRGVSASGGVETPPTCDQLSSPPTANRQLPTRLFGIIQGGLEEDLRAQSAEFISALPFDGVAVGGLAVGEAREDFLRLTELTGGLLPGGRVHYLMGVGEPADLLFAIAQGFDLFDCVQPTRMARHGVAYTGQGKLALHNARYTDDASPLDAHCACEVCRRHSRAYLRHLLTLGEHSYARLLTLHNLALYKALLDTAREKITAGTFSAWWPQQYPLLDRKLPDDV